MLLDKALTGTLDAGSEDSEMDVGEFTTPI